jgi:hypothetical protein
MTNPQHPAALATEAVELRIARLREILGSFSADDINRNGFYDEPFAVGLNLGKMAVAIKEAVAILNDNHWPGENEGDTPAAPVSAHIQKLRDRCAQEIRLALINLQHIDGTVNTKTSDRRRLAATVRRLIEINRLVADIDCILYSDTPFPQSDTQ